MPRTTLDDRDRELLSAVNFCHVSTMREDGTTGHVASETEDGALEHIDAMAKKYTGQDAYPFHQEGDKRVIFRIAPDRVHRHQAG